MRDKLCRLFAALDAPATGALDADAVVRFSLGVQGTVRVLLDRGKHVSQRRSHARDGNERLPSVIEIPASTPAEHDFLVKHFDVLFPASHPLDLTAFLSLVRRMKRGDWGT